MVGVRSGGFRDNNIHTWWRGSSLLQKDDKLRGVKVIYIVNELPKLKQLI